MWESRALLQPAPCKAANEATGEQPSERRPEWSCLCKQLGGSAQLKKNFTFFLFHDCKWVSGTWMKCFSLSGFLKHWSLPCLSLRITQMFAAWPLPLKWSDWVCGLLCDSLSLACYSSQNLVLGPFLTLRIKTLALATKGNHTKVWLCDSGSWMVSIKGLWASWQSGN